MKKPGRDVRAFGLLLDYYDLSGHPEVEGVEIVFHACPIAKTHVHV